MWSSVVAAIVWVGVAPAAPPCDPVADLVAADSVTRASCGASDPLGDGETLTLAAGGFFHVEGEGRGALCANTGGEPVEVTAGAAEAFVTSPALTCVDEDQGRRCSGPGLMCHAFSVTAQPPTTSPAAPAATEVFVLGFTSQDAAASEASIVERLVTVALTRTPGFRVSSGREVRELLAEEADRQAAGCSDGDCLAEIAGALGARYVVTGTVSTVGRAKRAELSLVDTAEATVVSRADAEAKDLLALGGYADTLVTNLLVPLRGGQAVDIPTPRFGRLMDDGDAFVGAGFAGGGALAGFACLAIPSVVVGLAVVLTTPGVILTSLTLPLIAPWLYCVPCTAGLCATGGAIAGDWWVDAKIGWLRAVTTGCSVCLFTGLFTTVAVVFGDVVVPGLYTGVTNRNDDWVWNAAFVSALSLSAVAVGLAGAGAYDIGIGVFGDEPVDVDVPPSSPPPPPSAARAQAY